MRNQQSCLSGSSFSERHHWSGFPCLCMDEEQMNGKVREPQVDCLDLPLSRFERYVELPLGKRVHISKG
ncbi:hypothetical protein TNIN_176971 [Trichonephila inaurata madagascariensis]|uniref:Uncharacterized protein n=1 Tax=Trichonephila inaurata madagascariensis TaxID=2747483 RepID=A0A8X7CPC4_9ARAC|nr:hypothetical protein TNIN_176971 [Trichonephila inaurata madagascariensis]